MNRIRDKLKNKEYFIELINIEDDKKRKMDKTRDELNKMMEHIII